jgi:polyketide biosynthesis enoyl-CoA hydratase PksH
LELNVTTTETTRLRTIEVVRAPRSTRIVLNRPERRNSLDKDLIGELREAFDAAGRDPGCRLVVLAAAPGPGFCVGMDLDAAARDRPADSDAEVFFALLRQMRELPKVIVATVDGQVAGGGTGLVAASDLVWATPRSTFALPEMLWGLLPCCVLPFLVQRCGLQFARAMTLSTLPVEAAEARWHGLVDRVAEDFEPGLRALSYRLSKVDPETVCAGKAYLRTLWPIDAETERIAVSEFDSLMKSAVVTERLSGGLPATGSAR